MKTIVISLLLSLLVIASCKKKEENPPVEKKAVPTRFNVEIPESISSAELQKSINSMDTLSGTEIYKHMRRMVNIADRAGIAMRDILFLMKDFTISQSKVDLFQGSDGRNKSILVLTDYSYEGTQWEYFLNMTDNGNKALQLFWNTNPLKGIAIFKSSELNHSVTQNPNSIIKIVYNDTDSYYDRTMEVSICGLDTINTNYAQKVKLFVGKKDNMVDVYGNSYNPKAKFAGNLQSSINWAFVAQANATLNIAKADICLPPCDFTTNTTILQSYSIANVLTYAISSAGITNQQVQQQIMTNSQSPGYYDSTGFVSCGTNIPSVAHSSLNISGLKPYTPMDIYYMDLQFHVY